MSTFCIASLFLGVSCSKDVLTEDVQQDIKEDIPLENLTNKSVHSIKLPIKSITSTIYSASENVSNIIDGDLNTAWSSSGDTWLYLDLGEKRHIDYVMVSYTNGNLKKYSSEWSIPHPIFNNYLKLIGKKTSSGNSTGLIIHDLINGTGDRMTIKLKGNNADAFNEINEIEVWGRLKPFSEAKELLGGLTTWKLNAYSGSLDVNSSNNGLTYVDNAPEVDNRDWFYVENNDSIGNYACFKTYPGNPTSSGSGNPRTELREMTLDGSSTKYWNGANSSEHSMKWKFRINNLPPSGKLCFGQIHERSDVYDDIIRVQCQGSGGQSTGDIQLRIAGYVAEMTGPNVTSIGIDAIDFKLDTEYYFELFMSNGYVKLYNINSRGVRINPNGQEVGKNDAVIPLFESMYVGDADENYFKAGCYLQSTNSSHYSSNTPGIVGIKYLNVYHSDAN